MTKARTVTKSTRLSDTTMAEFRAWLQTQIEHRGQTVNAIEAEAGIPGNTLGKFLRGERGTRYSLSPLQIGRLAPVLGVSEETMLSRAGHLSHLPDSLTVEQAILADNRLEYEDKRFLIEVYRRIGRAVPTGS